MRRLLCSCVLLLGVLSAAPAGGSDLPGWAEDRAGAWLPPLLATCRRIDGLPPDYSLGGTGEAARLAGRAAHWREVCAEIRTLDRSLRGSPEARDAAARAFLLRRFRPLRTGNGLLTGYYEPELRGALRRHGPFRTPLRALPPVPTDGLLPERAAIENGALDGLGLELVWVDDPVDAFFLQVQGSGRIRLAEGGVLRLGFAGRNGHPYRSIGRLLIERGAIAREAMSMQTLRAWLAAAPPAERIAVLQHNPSYVFFRVVEGLAPEDGPIGSLGVPLTPGRSLAVDPAFIPLGVPVWIVTRDPVDGTPLRRLVVAQDTGTAIRGPTRADLFWGWGKAAEARAGLMQEPAGLTLLLPLPAEPEAQPSPATAATSTGGAADLE